MLALVARPPSPPKTLLPLPATVVMMPATVTLRTTLKPWSAMYGLPLPSTARLPGFSLAAVAWPLSPLKASTPVPATVMITPVFAATLPTRLLMESLR